MKQKNIQITVFNIQWLFIICILFTSCRKAETLKNTKEEAAENERFQDTRPSQKPNIILILADDLGYETLKCNGGQSYSTPVLDRMAKNGMRFTRCHSSPMCSPSRFMLLTGKYNFRNYYTDSWGNLDLSQRTIANMLRDAGYETCAAGKWQLNGGDTSIHSFGFDKYMVTTPFKGNNEDLRLYKSPQIYVNGNFLPATQTEGKYGEDLCRNYMFDFIDSNRKKPFFIYWAPNLCHEPFSPTPDDPGFAIWDPDKPKSEADTIYFGSMIKYMDKEIGMLGTKLKNLHLEQNTIIIFLGDNGTNSNIHSLYDDAWVAGGKAKTIEDGIHVPLIVFGYGKVGPGTVNEDLIDFPDFLPTIAQLAGTIVPAEFGIMDGKSFAPQILGKKGKPRDWGYCYYDVNRRGEDGKPAKIWSLDNMYKFYDDKRTLFNYFSDPLEKSPINESGQTTADSLARKKLKAAIESYP